MLGLNPESTRHVDVVWRLSQWVPQVRCWCWPFKKDREGKGQESLLIIVLAAFLVGLALALIRFNLVDFAVPLPVLRFTGTRDVKIKSGQSSMILNCSKAGWLNVFFEPTFEVCSGKRCSGQQRSSMIANRSSRIAVTSNKPICRY